MVAVFVLTAGLGTRLRPLTSFLPKPLLPVGDRPALAHILGRVRGVAGHVVANAHYRADDLRAFLAASAPEVKLSEEPRILGTAGGLRAASALLGAGPALVWNGDILSDLDPSALLAAHGGTDAEGTLAVHLLPVGEGNVGLDAGGQIVRLRRETTCDGEVCGGSFLGIHVVGERLRKALPAEGCLVGDVYLPALRAGRVLRAFDATGAAWRDIGTLTDYESANLEWLARQPMEAGGSFVHPTARVAAGVQLVGSIVGEGATVEGEGRLRGCLVWPGARAIAPLARSVVTADGAVPFP